VEAVVVRAAIPLLQEPVFPEAPAAAVAILMEWGVQALLVKVTVGAIQIPDLMAVRVVAELLPQVVMQQAVRVLPVAQAQHL
jgi:hypothetical protein